VCLQRGLSGGQQKRVQIASALIASPSILLLDEPTSGLDSHSAFETLNCIRDILNRAQGIKLCVMLTIHQPNSKILALFDDVMVLNKGEMSFFGSASDAMEHFDQIGLKCPPSTTVTDHILQVADERFESKLVPVSSPVNLPLAFNQSFCGSRLQDVLNKHTAYCATFVKKAEVLLKREEVRVSLWRQTQILLLREYRIAYRDPKLYYVQLALHTMFAVLIGVVFWDLPYNVSGNFNVFPAALLWLVLLNCWVHAFKVYYFSISNRRNGVEIVNGKYHPFALLLAESISTAVLVIMFVPAGLLTYFMTGLPVNAMPIVMLVLWVTSLTAEAMVAVLTKLSADPTTSMYYVCVSFVVLQVFGGGVFLPWKDCPDYWLWLQEVTLFTHSSRAINAFVFTDFSIKCHSHNNGVCCDPGTGSLYRCIDQTVANGSVCDVDAREILFVTQGIGVHDNPWRFFGFLILLLTCFKGLLLLFAYWPLDELRYRVFKRVRKVVLLLCCCGGASFRREIRRKIRPLTKGGHFMDQSEGEGYADSTPSPACSGDDISSSVTTPMVKGFFRDVKGTHLVWRNFSVAVPGTNRKLIDNVSGFVCSGSLLALMGPSGSGKTTLLNGLADRIDYALTEGDVKFAGRVMTSQDLTYIPQVDELNSALTVDDHIKLIGKLTCTDEIAMQERLEEILIVLGLRSKRNTPFGRLSDGERKRVSIGVGLISRPPVLFLDEPTTGLDFISAYSIAQFLAKLAHTAKVAVIMTVQQPSAPMFDLFDDLYLLQGGTLVYAGSGEGSTSYFTTVGYHNPFKINPADYYLEICRSDAMLLQDSGLVRVSWAELFSKAEQGAAHAKILDDIQEAAISIAMSNAGGSFEGPGMVTRFTVLFWSLFGVFRTQCFQQRMSAMIIVAVLLGTLFFDLEPTTENANSYLGSVFCSETAVMLCVITATSAFARSRREAIDRIENGFYQPAVYVAAQFAVSLVMNLAIIAVYVAILLLLSRIEPYIDTVLLRIVGTWGLACGMEAVIMVLVECLKNGYLCTSGGLIFLGFSMLFSGFFRPQEKVPDSMSWLCYISPLHVSLAFALSNSICSMIELLLILFTFVYW